MLRIALPNKGALSEEAVQLFKKAGYCCKRHSRELMVFDAENKIEFIFLRPRDIAIYVSNGLFDLGITGRDLFHDSQSKVIELMALGFGKSKFHYALPKEKKLTPNDFNNLRIATSYPNLVKQDMAKRGLNVTIVKLDGAVEISIRLGVADVIADVVESGRTLKEAGLKIVGESILNSEAVVISHTQQAKENPHIDTMLKRLQGIVVARDYVVIEYDIHKDNLNQACQITPGLEAPTVATLSQPEWLAVKSMTKRKAINKIMDQLATIGAKAIMITEIMSCRL